MKPSHLKEARTLLCNSFSWASIWSAVVLSFISHACLAYTKQTVLKFEPKFFLSECAAGAGGHCLYPMFISISMHSQYIGEYERIPREVQPYIPKFLLNRLASGLQTGSDRNCTAEPFFEAIFRNHTSSLKYKDKTLLEQDTSDATPSCLSALGPGYKERLLLFWLDGIVVAWAYCGQAPANPEYCDLSYGFDDETPKVRDHNIYWSIETSSVPVSALHELISKMDRVRFSASTVLSPKEANVLNRIGQYSNLSIRTGTH